MNRGERVEIEFELGGADLERLVLVGGDLEYLMGLPQERLLTHTEVRLCAAILRRLLVDDQISRLWSTLSAPAGVELTVEATEIDTALSAWPRYRIYYAWAGGATSDGAHHTGFILAVVRKEDHEPYGTPDAFLKANPLPYTGEKRRMAIREWLRTTSVAIQTDRAGLIRISRADVLKYIANRKGGVHFDPQRTLGLGNKRKNRREVVSQLLDHGLLRVGHLSGPEYEVASMVQAIANSGWASGLVRAAQQAAPEDFHGDPSELKFWTGQKEADGSGWATTTFHPSRKAADTWKPPSSPGQNPEIE